MRYLGAGDVLAGRWRIEAELGRGGYSVVYRATDLRLESSVAVKLLVPIPATEFLSKERMRREALVARGLAHPNVVQLHDFVEHDGRAFLVMELVDGPDLARRVEAGGPLAPDAAVEVARGVAGAPSAAHARGVLHRDVKPRNILLDRQTGARLTDFGSARGLDMETVTRTGGIVGTIAYTAPEILAGERGDARSDLYALGVTLHFALTGRLPEQKSPHLPPAPSPVGFRLRAARPSIPPWLDDVTAVLTREDPGGRYPTASALAEALAAGEATTVLPPPDSGRMQCLLCEAPDPFGIGLCGACLGPTDGSGRVNERLLFLERGEDRDYREEIADEVWSRFGDERSEAEVTAALRGEVPLARVPAEAVDGAARRLRARGVPVRITHPARFGARLSPALGLSLGAAIAVGMAAGFLAAPPMLAITPVFAAAVGWSVVRRQKIALLSASTASGLPSEAERAARAALAKLPDGAAHRLLADLVRLARSTRNASSTLDATFTGLIRGAADLAAVLAELDRGLEVLERQRAARADAPDWSESCARVTQTRDRLVQRLLDAMAALARAHAADVEAGRGARARDGATVEEHDRPIDVVARELKRDAVLHAEAWCEIEDLLT